MTKPISNYKVFSLCMTSIILPSNNSQIVKQNSLKCNCLGVEGGDYFTS